MRIKKLLIILTISLGILLFLRDDLLDIYFELSLQIPQFKEEIGDLIQETEKQILTPPPLKIQKENPESFLTHSGVIEWTNIQRQRYGLPKLLENEKLNTSAELKIRDMFKKQYFAHNSPSGLGVGDLVKKAGYEFIIIGENLALGDFEDDEILVQSWMDSLGHRENISNSKYQEIGAAVLRDSFEGRVVWMAVQHFGLPLSACPQPNQLLEVEIKLNQNKIDELHQDLITLNKKIKSTRPKRGALYKELIEQYNALIFQYNELVEQTEFLINQYNKQVSLFNECVVEVK